MAQNENSDLVDLSLVSTKSCIHNHSWFAIFLFRYLAFMCKTGLL